MALINRRSEAFRAKIDRREKERKREKKGEKKKNKKKRSIRLRF